MRGRLRTCRRTCATSSWRRCPTDLGQRWCGTRVGGRTCDHGGSGEPVGPNLEGLGTEADPGGARCRHRRAPSSELAAMAGAPARKNRKSRGKKKGGGCGRRRGWRGQETEKKRKGERKKKATGARMSFHCCSLSSTGCNRSAVSCGLISLNQSVLWQNAPKWVFASKGLSL